MKKKSEFEAPYIGIETIDNTPIFYNRRGDYSVIIKIVLRAVNNSPG